MKGFTLSLLILLGLTLSGASLLAQDATEIMKKSHMAFYYAGDDGVAEVQMTMVNKKGKERVREFVMLRKDESDGGEQQYYTYFKKPSDVARMTFMVHKSIEGNDARWIYVPAVDLIKPISADDKNSSFVGSDFSYEDVSGRRWTEDNHTLTGESDLDGRPVYVIESVPKEPYKGFTKKITYVDKENFLPLKEEYFDDKGEMIRRFTAVKVDQIEGITTVIERKMEDLKKGTYTTVLFSSIDYNTGLSDDLFTERYLKNPPREFIK